MTYTLVVGEKRMMRFYILEVAELYQRIYGGVIFVRKDDGDVLV